jgi:hypothetical protein
MSEQTPGSSAPRDWTDEVTDRIEFAVSTVRDKATVPVIKATRAVVIGVIVFVLAVAMLLLVVMLLRRLLVVYLPIEPWGRKVWVTDAILGGLFLVAGAFCWSRRRARPSKEQTDESAG